MCVGVFIGGVSRLKGKPDGKQAKPQSQFSDCAISYQLLQRGVSDVFHVWLL